MALKDRISSPLEAGTSVLDAHYLPPHITPALEYTSSRLAKKSMHITLVVARRDYQLPPIIAPLASPMPSPKTPASPRFNLANGPVSALKHLVRPSPSFSSPTTPRSGMASPRIQQHPTLDMSSPRLRWPLSPTVPMSPLPMTPCTMTSATTADTMNSEMESSTFGMRLIHASRLPLKREKLLKSTLEKAEKRFQVGTEWISPSVSPAECGLSNQLINTSIVQNEVLFSGDGLTLLSLDRLYSLKSALSSYSKSGSHLRLEDAVDELRRIILANNGAKVTKADLLRSYDWLSVSNSALQDLARMYRRAYGGPEQFGGISGMPTIIEPVIRPQDESTSTEEEESEESDLQVDTPKNESPTIEIPKIETPKIEVAVEVKPVIPQPKGLALRLQTNFDTTPKKADEANDEQKKAEEDDEDEERTARATDQSFMTQTWNTGSTIDEVLSPGAGPTLLSPNRPIGLISPITPHDFGDLSPTTGAEWRFLMFDDAFKGAKTVAVAAVQTF